MSRKFRYILIGIGFILFLILAPAIVLYVRGISFDVAKGQFIQTGILAIRSDPSSAEILLNGQLVSNSVNDIKFLPPQEYTITIQKPGYQPWEKRLSVAGGQVTWASPVAGKIFLFSSEPSTTPIAAGVSDFQLLPNNHTVAFLSAQSLNLVSLDNPNNGTTLTLPEFANSILLSSDGNQALLTATATAATALYVNIPSGAVTNLSSLFSSQTSWYFSGNGHLYALNNKTFYAVNPQQKIKTLLETNIIAVTFLNGDIYQLKSVADGLHFQLTSDPSTPGQDILKGLPEFKQAEIIISYEKQAYILADGTLYKVGSQLEPLASNISTWSFNNNESSLVFFQNGELDYINPFDQGFDFISRRSSEVSSPAVRLSLSNVFFVENNTIKALELDTRDHQNEYDLYKGIAVKKFTLSDSGKTLVVLDAGNLKAVTVR